jgi:hypothetical protein
MVKCIVLYYTPEKNTLGGAFTSFNGVANRLIRLNNDGSIDFQYSGRQ